MTNVAAMVRDQEEKVSAQSQYESTDLKKYFTIALPEGVTKGEKTFRILPPINGQGLFVELWFHVIKVGGKQRKLYDPGKNEGKPSPLSAVYEGLKGTNDPQTKAQIAQYKPRLFYVVRGIDRDNEAHGVKFWRFPHDYKQGGVLDLIRPIIKKYDDGALSITDPEKGRDLSITLAKVKNPQGGQYTAISTILPNDPSPLSSNAQLAQQWLNDPITWENVYKKYDVEYLLLVAEGHIPTWSEAEGKWIPKPETDESEGSASQDSMGAAIGGAPAPAAQADLPATAEGGIPISPDDLPF